MTTGRGITLDCIIFGLQRFGGISNYWAQIVGGVVTEPRLACSLVVPNPVQFRELDGTWIGRASPIQERIDARYARYLRSNVGHLRDVFHTSYYRRPDRKVGKFVVTAYDFTYERYRSGLARLVHTRQKQASIRAANAVLCISEATRRDVIEFCPDVDVAKLHVVHLAADPNAFFKGDSDAPRSNEQTVLFVGQRGTYKRFDLAIDAVRQSSRLKLGVVGPALDSGERATLQRALGDRWHEFGPVSTTELRSLYASSFALVFPSDYEGFGLPVLEAMACGCPVVAAATSSLPEVGGQAALYPSDQSGEAYAGALRCLESSAERDRAVDAGLRRATEFSWSQTVDKTIAVYLND